MKKVISLFSVALAAVAMVSCSSDNAVESNPTSDEQVPVTFGSYFSSAARTRATGGTTGDMTNETLASAGFGVFGYYTGTSEYKDVRTTATPNFMYNTHVTGTTSGNTTTWSYSPLRYWPNPNGNTEQYVSFFAYAPYATTTGDDGITAMSANTATGDPTVSYALSSDATTQPVDLLWGTANGSGVTAATASGNAGKAYDANGETTEGTAVNADLSKQTIGGQVKFKFKHTLARLNKITVDLIADAVTHEGASSVNNNETRVTVKSIDVTSKGTNNASGTFNLVTGTWDLNTPASDATDITRQVSLDDGIKEPADGTILTTTTTDNGTSTTTWATAMPEGVTTTEQDAGTAGFYVLPQESPAFTVSITYIVRTLDPLLAKGYTEVTQTVSKDVTFSSMALNKSYNLAIHLGLTSVKFDATVEDWTDEESKTSVDLPLNVADATN